jgi:hypothetical protein
MALITTGVAYGFNVPGVPTQRVFDAWHWACTSAPQAYSRIANLSWAGSYYPMITLATINDPTSWARSYLYGWGRGRLCISNYPSLLSRMRAWPASTWNNLLYHEMGHILAYTWNQDITYPPHGWLVTRLQQHYGKPVAMPLDDQTAYFDLQRWAKPEQKVKRRWRNRIRELICRQHMLPVSETSWISEVTG